MKQRSPIRKLSEKRLKSLNGKPIFSSISPSGKGVKRVNTKAKAKRDKRYKAHLSSAYWKALRLKVWERLWINVDGLRMCQHCGAPLVSITEMQLAHLTYARFGKELDEDVEGQCKQCNQTEAALRGKRIRRTA